MSVLQDERARELSSLLREADLGRVSADHDEAELERLMGELAKRDSRKRPGRARKFAVWAAAAAFAVCGSSATWLSARSAPLTYTVQSASMQADGQISASDRPIDLQFSDGSELQAERGTSIRVTETRAHGATILLGQGAASTRVVHTRDSRWQIVAGPFFVQVIGTRLVTRWDPSNELLDVSVQEGAVQVESSILGRVPVRAGQRLLVNARSGEHQLSGSSPDLGLPEPNPPKSGATQPGELAVSDRAHGAAESDPASSGSSLSMPPKTDSHRTRASLTELVATGDFQGAMRAAETIGLDRCLAICAPSELRALADAARYTGRRELAGRALDALRRLPESAALAAFLLGRHYESAQPTEALKWYETYLGETPNGSFAPDALAGKMRALEATHQKDGAAAAAREYLRRYPDGIHEKTARRVLGLVP